MAKSIITSKYERNWSRSGTSVHTQSDSEVILSSYEQWGAACVQRFVGMWALAIWDTRKEELSPAPATRFGIKPFLYILEGDRFYFGSEYKALRPSPVFSNDLNMRQNPTGSADGLGSLSG